MKHEIIHKIENRFFKFELWGVRRETPNEFTELHDAFEDFKLELFKLFKIPQLVKWLNKKMSNITQLDWLGSYNFKNIMWLIMGFGILFICGMLIFGIYIK